MRGKLIAPWVLVSWLFAAWGAPASGADILVSGSVSSQAAVQDDYLVWSEYSATPIRKVPKYGGTPSVLANIMGAAMNLTIHEGHIFWIMGLSKLSAPGSWTDRVLTKASLDGSANTYLAVGQYVSPDIATYADMVADGDSVYWVTSADTSTYSIRKVSVASGDSTTLMTVSKPIMSLTRDASRLYWIERKDDGYDRGVIRTLDLPGGAPVTVYEAPEGSVLLGVMTVSAGVAVFLDSCQGSWRLMKIGPGEDPVMLVSLSPPTGTADGPTDRPQRIVVDGDDVYWVDQHSVNTVPLAGGARRVLADNLSYPQDLAVADGNVFWAQKRSPLGPGRIGKVAAAGGPVTILADSLELPMRIVLEGAEVYWAEGWETGEYVDGRIARVSKDGGPVRDVVTGVANPMPRFASDNTNLYLADGYVIKKVSLSGGTVEKMANLAGLPNTGSKVIDLTTDGLFVYCLDGTANVWKIPVNGGQVSVLYQPPTPKSAVGPIRLAGDTLYWAEDYATIRKKGRNGGSAAVVSSGLPYLSDFVTDGQHIYFSGNDTGYLYRVPVNGGPFTVISDGGLSYSWNILALDQDYVYCIDQAHFHKVPKAGGTGSLVVPDVMQSHPDYPSAITLDQGNIYWTETGSGKIMTIVSYVHQTPLRLSEGWNFISPTDLPAGGAIETVFGGVLPLVDIVWGFDNQQKIWRKWRPGDPSNTLLFLEFGAGYWVYMTASGTIDRTGWVTAPSTRVVLRDGWNLIGYLGTDNTNASEALASLYPWWAVAWGWTSGQWRGKLDSAPLIPPPHEPLTGLNRGKAYWIKIRPGMGPVEWVQ